MSDITERLRPFFSFLPHHAVIAIDGRCGSGKTTLAAELAREFRCRVVHMDDFFLPPAMRTPQRLAASGGNVHYERFLRDVSPLLRENSFSFDAFDCSTGGYVKREYADARYTIVEGSYSLHPRLRLLYDLKIFLDIDPETQRERILLREGDRAPVFFERWIPLEEKYFSTLRVKELCDAVIKVGK